MKKVIPLLIFLVLVTGINSHLHAQEKSTALALGLSIGVPVLSLLTGPGIIVGLTVAPSAGHFYAGQWGRGLVFSGLRTAVLLVAAASALPYPTSENMGTFYIGLGIWGAITLVDWCMIPSSVEKYNKRFQFTPEININDGNYGIGFSYHF
jgi:hypothetical protein